MTATLENTAGYTQQELDRFNAMVARETDGMDEYEAQQYEKNLSDEYLCRDASEWDL